MKPNINIICPNKATDEWRQLVAGLGDERLAFIAFFRNHDEIPTVEVAWQKLGMQPLQPPAAAPVKPPEVKQAVVAPAPKHNLPKSKKPKVAAPKIVPRFNGVALSKIEGDNLAILFGQTRYRGDLSLSRPRRKPRFVAAEKLKANHEKDDCLHN
jgi:hypothetical protein